MESIHFYYANKYSFSSDSKHSIFIVCTTGEYNANLIRNWSNWKTVIAMMWVWKELGHEWRGGQQTIKLNLNGSIGNCILYKIDSNRTRYRIPY